MPVDMDLCQNCDHWREEHYQLDGSWNGEAIGCAEYLGTVADPQRRKKKPKDLEQLELAELAELEERERRVSAARAGGA